MKAYKLWLIFLKVAMIVQLGLIIAKVQKEEDVAYLVTDILFKSSLGIFLIMYFYINGSSAFNGWDEVFISFGGSLLLFDAWYNTFPKVLKQYGYYLNPYTLYFSDKPEIK